MKSDRPPSLDLVWNDNFRQALCFDLWAEFDRIAYRDYPSLFPRGEQIRYKNESHQIVRWLEVAANQLNSPNLHLGLTSSDIEENARLLQIRASAIRIETLCDKVKDEILVNNDLRGPWIARTHWRPAGITGARHLAWMSLFREFDSPVLPKLPQGITGDNFETPPEVELIVKQMNWRELGFQGQPRAAYRQSTEQLVEIRFASWLAEIAAAVTKVCADVRFLCGSGELITDEDVASSAAPDKRNPAGFETAQSIASTVPGAFLSVWQACAHDGLEGTLTRRWSLDHELARTSIAIGNCLERLVNCLPGLRRGEVGRNPINTDYSAFRVTQRVLDGERRDEAYNQER